MLIHWFIEVKDKTGSTVEHKEQTVERFKDRFQSIRGDQGAKVTVSLTERIGGPYGYSQVSLGVTVSLQCHQSEDMILRAETMALEESMEFLDSNFGTAHQLLVKHLGEYYGGSSE